MHQHEENRITKKRFEQELAAPFLAVLAVMSRIPFFRWFTKPILKREKHEETGA